jgi:hypothetical protein
MTKPLAVGRSFGGGSGYGGGDNPRILNKIYKHFNIILRYSYYEY